MGKIRCEQADFAEFAALPTNDRQFVIPNMFSIENWIINVEVATKKIILQIRGIHDWRFLSCNGDSKSPSSIRTAECFWPLSVLNGVNSVRKIETGLEWVSGCWGNWETLCSCSRITRGDPPRKSSSLIRAAEYFRPLHKLIGVKSVQKIATGLECDQRLLTKLKITVTGAHCATLLCEHSISQFSRQSPTPFEPRFNFPDRLDPYQLM